MSPAVGSVMLSGPRPRSQLGRYCCTSPYASVAEVPTNSSSLSTSPDPARRRFVSGAGPVAAAPVGTIAGRAGGAAGGDGGGGGGGGAVAVSRPGPRYTSAPVFVLISAALPPRSRNPTTVGRLSPPPSVTDAPESISHWCSPATTTSASAIGIGSMAARNAPANGVRLTLSVSCP